MEPKNVQHRGIRADRDAHAAILDVAQRHHRHTCALRNEFCREPAAEPSGADSFTKTRKLAFHRREQWSDTLCHAIILAHYEIRCNNNGTHVRLVWKEGKDGHPLNEVRMVNRPT